MPVEFFLQNPIDSVDFLSENLLRFACEHFPSLNTRPIMPNSIRRSNNGLLVCIFSQ